MAIKTCGYFPIAEMTRSIFWGRKIVRRMGLYFGTDAFRQLCVLSVLKQWLPQNPGKILIIGDGPGILGAFLYKHWPKSEINLLDLGATLTIQAQNLTKAFPDAAHQEGLGGGGGGWVSVYSGRESLFGC
jgi:hypothetical protein